MPPSRSNGPAGRIGSTTTAITAKRTAGAEFLVVDPADKTMQTRFFDE